MTVMNELNHLLSFDKKLSKTFDLSRIHEHEKSHYL